MLCPQGVCSPMAETEGLVGDCAICKKSVWQKGILREHRRGAVKFIVRDGKTSQSGCILKDKRELFRDRR